MCPKPIGFPELRVPCRELLRPTGVKARSAAKDRAVVELPESKGRRMCPSASMVSRSPQDRHSPGHLRTTVMITETPDHSTSG
jgi:hypothetical protein